jgi:UrcA family protein
VGLKGLLVMTYSKILSMCAAIAVTAGGLTAMSPSASAKDRPVVVVAPSDVITRRVSYTDLNLAIRSDEKTLTRRVGSAVRWVCEEALGNARDFYAEMQCRDVSWDLARPQMKRAVQRAHDFAAAGSSPIAAEAIVLASAK